MKKTTLLTISLSLIFAIPASAKMVHYFDERGRIHYVDTRYQKVPDRYLDQVKDQLEKEPKEVKKKKKPEINREPLVSKVKQIQTSPTRKPKQVVVFIGPGCAQCSELDMFFLRHMIVHTRYDIGTHPMGREMYNSLGVSSLPVIIIDGEIIEGFDPELVLSLIKGDDGTQSSDDGRQNP